MTASPSLPSSWSLARLGDLGEWGSGGTPLRSNSSFYDGEIPWLKIGDLTDGPIWSSETSITRLGLASSSAKLLEPGAVLLAMYGSIGKLGINKIECATNQAIAFCRHDPRLITREYLFHGLSLLKPTFLALGQGGTQQNISQTLLKEVLLPIAPLSEQHRIVEKIEVLSAQLDKGEEALRAVQKQLSRYRQSVLKAAVTGQLTGSDPVLWKPVVLGELLEDIRYGTAKKCHPNADGVAVLRIPNVANGEIDLQDLKFTQLHDREVRTLGLKKGDLLIVRSTGSANLVGRGAVVTDDAVGLAFAGYLIRLRVDQKRLLPDFLQLVLSSPVVRALIERQARSTSGVHNINSGEVKAIAFDLPPIDVQSEIVELVDGHMAKIGDLDAWCQTELTRSTALRQSILRDAFAGRLVPQNSTDEPAETLLARITENRAVTPQQTRKSKARI